MTRGAYYNEFEPYAAEWLRNLIAAGRLPAGDVDTRSIVDVGPDDVRGYSQCHFFAGIGGWALAARLAGWPDDREIWTGSPPCQPFSVAGRQRGADDDRHLWPHFFRLIGAGRPAVVMGEQVAAAVGKDWLDGVLADLEGIDYAGRAVVVPACAVNAPHRRDRLWFVAERGGALGDGERAGLEGLAGHVAGESQGWDEPYRPVAATGLCGDVEHPSSIGRGEGGPESELWGGRTAAPGAGVPRGDVADGNGRRFAEQPERDGGAVERGQRTPLGMDAIGPRLRGAWGGAGWIVGHDGKARRVPESGLRLLAHGVPARVGRLRAYGNAIVPQVAAEVIAAYMGCRP